jgi:hypothetical protein
MSTTPKHASDAAAGDDRNLVRVDENYLAPTFEDRLRIFWEKNSRSVLAACALVLVVILGKGAYQFYEASRAKASAAAYAAATTDDQLKTFIADHAGDPLAGLAQLRLADKAYTAADYAAARDAYGKAAGILKKDTFGERARLGAALSAVQAGATAEGTAALKQIVDDISAHKLFRSEAAYHLAALSAAAGDSAEALRLIEQATAIDPEGQWADRASFLRSTLPAATAAVPVTQAPSVKFN